MFLYRGRTSLVAFKHQTLKDTGPIGYIPNSRASFRVEQSGWWVLHSGVCVAHLIFQWCMLVFKGYQGSRGLHQCWVHTPIITTNTVCEYVACACVCVCECGVGWARIQILSRPTAWIHSVMYYRNTGGPQLLHIREKSSSAMNSTFRGL